ncbi:hypothetical protein DXG01_005325 [Tephrocybe rancida]|nr:hypothetical protein DXG01_005325 [Tephrocybe rancida]
MLGIMALQPSIVAKYFQELKNRDADRQLTAALDLRRYLSTTVPELPLDATAKLWDNDINRRLFELTHSELSYEAFGGLVAIGQLLDIELAELIDSKRNFYRFWNYIKHLLPKHDIKLTVAASTTLGRIAATGGAAFGESFMDKEVPGAIEMMNQEPTRYAGVLLLKELASNSPIYFHSHVGHVFEHILVPLRDRRLLVREATAELLAACLEVISQREHRTNSPYLSKLLHDAQGGLVQTAPEVIHGSLLTFRQAMLYAGESMRDVFLVTAEKILNFKTHRELLIRKMVITLIPTFAAYDMQTFNKHLLNKAIAQLLTSAGKTNERASAFLALGDTAMAVGNDITPFLEPIMKRIEQELQERGKNTSLEVFHCISMLVASVGPNLTQTLHDNLDLMFTCELSDPLRKSLIAITEHIPSLLNTIQNRLLHLIGGILSGTPYTPLGAPPHLVSTSTPVSRASVEATPELIILALQTLGSFDFTGHVLNEFVHVNALPFLDDERPEVRRAAAVTSCRLLIRDPIFYQASSHTVEVINDVLNKLLAVGIADPNASVRHDVLSSLHERFDKHLAQAENVRSLFIVLNDEHFENRVVAVGLIGRLANHNPGYIMPPLRKLLIQLLTELEYSVMLHSREECTRLLMLLISATQRLIKPYALPMLRALLEKANDVHPTVSANVLMCLGELTYVAGEDAAPFVAELMQVIMLSIEDPSVIKRDAALHVLGQVCSSTGYVITPLIDHPQLLEFLGRILKTENRKPVRREVLKVLGIVGAMDPYRRTIRLDGEASEPVSAAVNLVPLKEVAKPATGDQLQSVVFNALLEILKDQTLNGIHAPAIEAIMSVFKTHGLGSVNFLPQVIPAFAAVARSSPTRLGFYLEQLAILIGIVKHNIRNFVPDIMALINELWDNSTLHLPIVFLIEALGKVLDAEFKPFLPTVLPLILKAFDGGPDEKTLDIKIKIFDALLTFGTNMEEYLQLILPIIVSSYSNKDGTTLLRKRAIQAIEGLSRQINFTDHASRIIHPLVRVLDTSNNELRMTAMDALCSLTLQLGSDSAIFIPTISKSIHKHKIVHPKYEDLAFKVLNGHSLPQDSAFDVLQSKNKSLTEGFFEPAEATTLIVNQEHLKQSWDVSRVSTSDDWVEWLHHLAVEFIKESTSHALRACMTLVEMHAPLGRQLFNAAFLSCWKELHEQYQVRKICYKYHLSFVLTDCLRQEDLIISFEYAMTSLAAPSDIVYFILDLAEFMEHKELPLPIEHKTLGEYALKCAAYAKALHYKELEFFSKSSPAVVESLISINTKLQQHDAAWGTLLSAHEHYNVTKHEEWYERLGRWHDALEAYNVRAERDPNDRDVQIGRIKCLHALGEWDSLSAQVRQLWSNASQDHRREVAPMAAAAAWSLHDWDRMDDYIATMQADSPDRAFYRAILSVHRNQFPRALTQIAKARDLLYPELDSLVGEGYGRSYNVIVRAQMLSELEEVILYKRHADQPERQKSIRNTWMKRLRGCQPNVEVWQRVLQVRTLVLDPETDPGTWIRFTNLCRKAERIPVAEKAINSLLSPHLARPHDDQPGHTKAPPHVVYTQLKLMWAMGSRTESLEFLRRFSLNLSRDLAVETDNNTTLNTVPTTKLADLSKFLARCYFKTGQWQAEVSTDWGKRNVDDILKSYHLATHFDPSWYKAWHTWAMANFEVVSYMSSHSQAIKNPDDRFVAHIVQAVDGFFRSITLKNEEPLQDTLRLLTLWFKYGSIDDVSHAMRDGFTTVEVVAWLAVIPQIIARIQTPDANIRQDIKRLLVDIGGHHPQALIYPLTVASKSSNISRRNAALSIMGRMREHSSTLVSQGFVVIRELVRVAILWHELWRDGIEDASKRYYTEKDPDGMIATLAPLHDMLKSPTTAREVSFIQAYGKELQEARDATRKWRTHGDAKELDKAWDIYSALYKKIDKQQQQMKALELQYVSPSLLIARDLELAVPGHEDLRQDERVMQLFGLVNGLLSTDTESFKRRLHIQRYPVIPLDTNVGLMGWVQGTDTLHALIIDYRQSRKVLNNIEHRLMLQMAPDYEKLMTLQQIEVFEHALESTTGLDLYRILWLKSTSSEHWLERRATYTRSLAVNSMVGYILGLGDRHPANLLLERSTGKVVHIDFGDCFEVAMDREHFVEKVPFRLTRMLTRAMEVSGIEGSFRKSCEVTMRVQRDNKDSLLAVLEAFVYDPLITWRLMQTKADVKRTDALSPVSLYTPVHLQVPARKLRTNENDIFGEAQDQQEAQEDRNERALAVYNRVQHKLSGEVYTHIPLSNLIDEFLRT